MTGLALIIVFVVCIILMIVAIARFKAHPFIALLAISLILAFASGMPLQDIKSDGVLKSAGILTTITDGFSSTFKGIGLVIIFGAAIGALLECTGAAITIANTIVKAIGKNHPELATLIMGWIVSIPVFCDSGFVILNPIRKAMMKKTKHSSTAMTICLSAGLYASHVFIPPTPGPIAAANALNVSHNPLLIMGIGMLVSIPALAASYLYAMFIGKRVKAQDELEIEENMDYEQLLSSYKNLPSAFLSFLPIVLPIILMALSSIVSVFKIGGNIANIILFIGNPIIALGFGLIAASVLYFSHKPEKAYQTIIDETLKTVGPILFITAAGGVLGKVIANSDMINYITNNIYALSGFGIAFPFLLSAILKTAQGSSTVALVTTASIMAPLMGFLNLDSDILRVLTVLAIGAGAMTVSHANDSYFWVVTRFGSLNTQQGYKTQTIMTLIEGISSIICISILWFIFR